MQNSPENTVHSSFRAVIDKFIQDRLQVKLDALKDDDPKRNELIARYQRDSWLEAAAKRAKGIRIATHLVKPINPRARGTNILWSAAPERALDGVGTHSLAGRINPDVTGDAAAFDVYALLCLKVADKTLLMALTDKDREALEALSSDKGRALALADQFLAVATAADEEAASHPLAKQLYWLAGEDACADSDFHLLAPLYSSPLAQAVYEQIQHDRFSDEAKEAREAFYKGKAADGVHRVYAGLAVQKLGGTKAQTVSRHNLNRRGTNYLLSSLPPRWEPKKSRLPVHAESVFDGVFSGRKGVRHTVQELRRFLEGDSASNKETRDIVEELVERLIDAVVIMAGEIQNTLAPGWSCHEDYENLSRAEQLWLDPLRAEIAEEEQFAQEWLAMDWPEAIAKRFGQWLNASLEGNYIFGDEAQRQWKKWLLVDERADGWAQKLHRLRKKLDAPTYISTRQPSDALGPGEVPA